MTLRAAGFSERLIKVCLGDAFVYGLFFVDLGSASNQSNLIVLESFILIFLRLGYEC